MRPRGAVSIGGDAAGAVVVVVEGGGAVEVDGAGAEIVVVDGLEGLDDEEHAPASVTPARSATQRPRFRRTPS
jgi:hypothetical protein